MKSFTFLTIAFLGFLCIVGGYSTHAETDQNHHGILEEGDIIGEGIVNTIDMGGVIAGIIVTGIMDATASTIVGGTTTDVTAVTMVGGNTKQRNVSLIAKNRTW
eukprot:175944_1